MNLEELKKAGEAPSFLTIEALQTLEGGYLLPGETPVGMYRRVAQSAAKYLKKPELAETFYQYMMKNWLCLSSPVASNCGTTRGLPISCVPGDMMINTPGGVKRMEDIEVGDLVLTHKGRYRKVTHKQSRMSSGDMFELKVINRPTRLRITGNHPVLTNLGWMRVDQLDKHKHLVAINGDIEYLEQEYVIDTQKHINIRSTPRGTVLPKNNVFVDEDLAWAFGLWFAEGSITKDKKQQPNALRITLNVDEQELGERWLAILNEKFGVTGRFYISRVQRNGKEHKWLNVYASSRILAEWFTTEFGEGCKYKQMPKWLVDLPKPQCYELLKAFMLGDGSLKRGVFWDCVLSNPYLIGNLYSILLKLSVPCSVNFTHNQEDRYYEYRIRYLDRYALGKATENKKHSNTSGIKFHDGLVYSPINSLIKLNEDELVYDITVEEDESFSVAGVVVHNCYASAAGDSLDSIFSSFHESAMLMKHGGGTGKYWGLIRPRGSEITGNGRSDGIIPWLKVEEATLASTSQGGVRRGSGAQYLHIDSPEIEEFIDIRRETGGDPRRKIHSKAFHHGVCITDEFMESLKHPGKNREIWAKLLQARHETGEPYVIFIDTVNNNNPQCYKDKGLKVLSSNLCSEITLMSDEDHTFVCCLSSVNLAKYHEWKDTRFIQDCIWFLDGIMSEFIDKAKGLPGFDKAVRFSEKSRALGLGVVGWHTLLQQELIPFSSFKAMQLNAEIFSSMQVKSIEGSKELAEAYGEPEWCKGHGVRNTHTGALAPTTTNALISGGVSQGIEPIMRNYYAQSGAKGLFIRKNKQLQGVLKELGKDTSATWNSINENGGSVQHLDFLPNKEVFLTFPEIDQFSVIRQAAQRQKWIDQSQSVNLFVGIGETEYEKKMIGKQIHQLHMLAWELGMKGLYYMHSESGIKGSTIYEQNSCKSCEG